jgi:ribonuclease P protein component
MCHRGGPRRSGCGRAVAPKPASVRPIRVAIASPLSRRARRQRIPAAVRRPSTIDLELARSEQAHVPAEQSPSRQDARLPPAHAHPSGPLDSRRSAAQGPRSAVCLTADRPDHVLPPEHRLRHTADFRRVLRRGRRSSSSTLVVHALPGSAGVRVGFAVSRGVGGAVVRNRVRRRLREAIRAQLGSLEGRGAWDLVVRATPKAATATYAELCSDTSAALASRLFAADSPPRAVQA